MLTIVEKLCKNVWYRPRRADCLIAGLTFFFTQNPEQGSDPDQRKKVPNPEIDHICWFSGSDPVPYETETNPKHCSLDGWEKLWV